MQPLLDPLTNPALNDKSLDALQVEALESSAQTALVTQHEASSAPAADRSTDTAKQPQNPSFWRIFSSTFVTIFLAEIGDKTQVSTLLMSAEFHQPWVVFWGAGTALVATTLLGVWVGTWLSARLSPRTLDLAAGILLALISASLFWDGWQMMLHP